MITSSESKSEKNQLCARMPVAGSMGQVANLQNTGRSATCPTNLQRCLMSYCHHVSADKRPGAVVDLIVLRFGEEPAQAGAIEEQVRSPVAEDGLGAISGRKSAVPFPTRKRTT
jgi:hypothetical protein